jgi:hypothetical protein
MQGRSPQAVRDERIGCQKPNSDLPCLTLLVTGRIAYTGACAAVWTPPPIQGTSAAVGG